MRKSLRYPFFSLHSNKGIDLISHHSDGAGVFTPVASLSNLAITATAVSLQRRRGFLPRLHHVSIYITPTICQLERSRGFHPGCASERFDLVGWWLSFNRAGV